MKNHAQISLAALTAIALGAGVVTFAADRSGLLAQAQAQTEDDKRKKEREKKAQPPPPPPKGPPLPPKGPPPAPPPKATLPPPAPRAFEKPLPPPDRRTVNPQWQQTPPPKPPALPEPRKEGIKQLPPGKLPPQPSTGPAPTWQKTPPPVAKPEPKGPTTVTPTPPPPAGKLPPQPPTGPAWQKTPPPVAKPDSKGPITVTPRGPLGPTGPVPKRFEEVQKGRIERLEDGGRRKVIQEHNRIIVKQDNRIIIRHDEAERFRRRPDARTERRADGTTETFHVRGDGVRIITVMDRDNRLLRRYRRAPDGREWNIIDNRRFYRNAAIGLGVGVGIGIIVLNLPPPRIIIPPERYIVDYDRASDDDLYEALDAPPIEALDRPYSLEEIRSSYELRARLRSVDLDTINFDFGSWEVPPDQYYRLERIARAIMRVLRRNPEALFMIAGFTDAVGSEEDNLSLSDRRAAAVAEVLSDTFGIPAENLVTQGYGEQYLKIDTQGPEPRNRRVSFLNLTGLMAER